MRTSEGYFPWENQLETLNTQYSTTSKVGLNTFQATNSGLDAKSNSIAQINIKGKNWSHGGDQVFICQTQTQETTEEQTQNGSMVIANSFI